ncbi:MAG: hypothetical protein ACHP7N_11070 [Caulobacterales bacterium]
MAEFPVTEVASAGFRLVRERPKVAIIWAAIQFVALVAQNAFVEATADSAFEKLRVLISTSNTDPKQFALVLQGLEPTAAVLLAFSLVFSAFLYAAMNRAALRPHADRFGYLRVGLDEVRQFGVLALIAGLTMAACMAAGIVVSLVAELIAGAVGTAAASALMLPALVLSLIAAIAVLNVRLSLASPLAFATGRVNLFEAWRLTRGRFWMLARTYLMALALGLLVWTLGLTIAAGVIATISSGLGPVAAGTTPNADFFSPANIAYLAFCAFASGLTWPIWLMPPALIYHRLARAHGLPDGANGSRLA